MVVGSYSCLIQYFDHIIFTTCWCGLWLKWDGEKKQTLKILRALPVSIETDQFSRYLQFKLVCCSFSQIREMRYKLLQIDFVMTLLGGLDDIIEHLWLLNRDLGISQPFSCFLSGCSLSVCLKYCKFAPLFSYSEM